MTVHSILPAALTDAVDEVLKSGGVERRALAPLPVIAFDGIQREEFPE